MTATAEPTVSGGAPPSDASPVADDVRPPWWRRTRVRESGLAALLLVPSLAIFGVFIFYPLIRNAYLGFYRSPPFPGLPKQYVGFDQYRDVLTSEPFLESLRTTVVFAVLTVPAGIVLGLGLAVLAHQQLRGIAIYRTFFSSTVATSVAVAAVIFGTLMNPQVGLLPWLGITTDPPILQNTTWALPAVAVTTVWQTLGLTFILMSAGLQGVPDELLEAARVDGASEGRIFLQIVVPVLMPILITLALFTFLAVWNDFMWPLIILTDQDKYTLPVALAALSREHVQDNEMMRAGSVLTVIPVLVLFLSLQRYYLQGLLAGSVKG